MVDDSFLILLLTIDYNTLICINIRSNIDGYYRHDITFYNNIIFNNYIET